MTLMSPMPVRVTLEGGPEAVREAIALVMQSPPLCGLASEDCGAAELVLAEVLNNVIEHAYGGSGGRVEMQLCREGAALCCQIIDQGPPLLSGGLPAGLAPRPEDLAEGGYGWFLIRSLSRDLLYCREGGSNRLSFRLIPSASAQMRSG